MDRGTSGSSWNRVFKGSVCNGDIAGSRAGVSSWKLDVWEKFVMMT